MNPDVVLFFEPPTLAGYGFAWFHNKVESIRPGSVRKLQSQIESFFQTLEPKPRAIVQFCNVEPCYVDDLAFRLNIACYTGRETAISLRTGKLLLLNPNDRSIKTDVMIPRQVLQLLNGAPQSAPCR